jgi:hypothetical protein
MAAQKRVRMLQFKDIGGSKTIVNGAALAAAERA